MPPRAGITPVAVPRAVPRLDSATTGHHDLLQTKRNVPLLRPNTIIRNDLIHRLDSARGTRLILVTAPAGFGKTTLVSSWLATRQATEEPLPVAWLSLDDADNDAGRFWLYVVAALRTLAPHAGRKVEAMLGRPAVPRAETWLPVLLHDLEIVQTPFTLVLDDYQVIHTRGIHQSLGYFLHHLPGNGQLVLIARADPPLQLSRLRVQGELVEIRSADLLFTGAETEAYLNSCLQPELSPGDVARIAQRTEGWPAGVRLAARSMQGIDPAARHDFVQSFSGSNRLVLDYLLEEVLKQQQAPMRDFLLRTATLPQASGALCAAVTGQQPEDAGRVLSRLAGDCPFITALDPDGNWFHYHSLFAEALATQLRQQNPAEWRETHRHASRWCAQNGRIEWAVQLALAASEWEDAAALVEAHGDRLWSSGNTGLPLRWLETLPQDVVEHRISLRLLQIWLLRLNDRRDEAAGLWEQTGRLITATPDAFSPVARGRWAAMGGAVGRSGHDADEAVRLAQQALALLPSEDSLWRAVSQLHLGLAYQMQGQCARAADTYRAMADLCLDHGFLYLTFAALAHLIESCFNLGHLYEAQAYCERLQDLEALPGGDRLALGAAGAIGLGRLAYERNNLTLARTYLEPSIDRCWPEGQPRLAIIGRIVLAKIYRAGGDLATARDQLETALVLAVHLRLLREENMIRAEVARLALAEGCWDCIRSWQAATRLSAHDVPDSWREHEYLVLAEVLIAGGDYPAAEALLARLRAAAERTGRAGSDIPLSLLYAVTLSRQKRFAEAEIAARRVLPVAQAQNYVRTILDLGSPVIELLSRPGVRSQAPEYIDRLVGVIGHDAGPLSMIRSNGHSSMGSSGLAGTNLVDPLTPREGEILTLIARGASNQEIADRLVLSVGTVKGHVNHIFSKLDVHSRTAAVARARDCQLIPS